MDTVESFVGGWFHWLETGSLPQTQKFSPDIEAAMDSQSRIGWDQVLHGRVATAWRRLRPDGNRGTQLGTRPADQLSLWVVDTLDALWRAWFDIWEERNGYVHGKTKQEQSRKRRAAVEQEIKEIYNRKWEYIPSDRALLTGTAESFVEHKSLPAMTNWLAVWQPVFERSAARCLKLAIRGVPPITTFFKPPAST